MKWRTSDKIEELSQPGMHNLTLRNLRDGSLMAFASVLECTEPDCDDHPIPVLYIYEFHVLPAHQGQGIGLWLLDKVIDWVLTRSVKNCQKIMLTVQTANIRAVKFYERLGFAADPICPTQCLPQEKAKSLGYMIFSRPLRPNDS